MKKLLIALILCPFLAAACGNGNADSSDKGNDTIVKDSLPDSLTISMVGDIMMGTTFPVNKLPENGGANMFDDCKDILRQSDMAVGNLESAMLTGGKTWKTPSPRCFAFRTPPEYVNWLLDAGFDFVGTANNHANDFLEDGSRRTRELLDSVGLPACGWAGERTYQIVERKGVKFGLTAFSRDAYNLCSLDSALVDSIIHDLRKRCDILVVSLHAGAEGQAQTHLPNEMEYFQGEPRGFVRQLTKRMVDAGADIVYCHGPHVPRCVNLYKGKFIAYSLGNFCTISMGTGGYCGMAPLIKITVDAKGNFLRGNIFSFKQLPHKGPRADCNNDVAKLIKTRTEEDCPDSPLQITEDGVITKK